jgi:hypothetical protein
MVRSLLTTLIVFLCFSADGQPGTGEETVKNYSQAQQRLLFVSAAIISFQDSRQLGDSVVMHDPRFRIL